MTERITPETGVGAMFAGPVRTLTLGRVLAFSGGPIETPGWPAKNLHTDGVKAAEAGLPAPIASGIQYEGYLVELLIRLFGDRWFREGELRTKYPRTVSVGDAVRPMARVASRSEDGDRVNFDLDVWCERSDSEKVLVGTARCAVSTVRRTRDERNAAGRS
ncbi:MAG: MaoC family dehydratase [Rhodospirillaceae bacterium]|nr:MaoC family dehydratase [Rhodospirillaceae bacterium]